MLTDVMGVRCTRSILLNVALPLPPQHAKSVEYENIPQNFKKNFQIYAKSFDFVSKEIERECVCHQLAVLIYNPN